MRNSLINGKGPRILEVIGGIVSQIRWLGHLASLIIIGGSIFLLYDEFGQIWTKGIFEFFLLIAVCLSLSLGFASFAGNFGRALQEGKRSALLGMVVILVPVTVLARLIAVLSAGHDYTPTVYRVSIALFYVSLIVILLSILLLIIYWKDLKSGVNIYEE
jgi:hypothetical protein